MIVGIGTDIVRIARFERMLLRHGQRIAERILHQAEMPAFQDAGKQAAFLAKRFAAKEATAKAFGTGFRSGLSMRHIAVDHDDLGCPQLIFTGYASELCRRLGVNSTRLSLADEAEYAIAFVVLCNQPSIPS